MPTDRYGNTLTTTSDAACDAYVEAVDLLFSGAVGAAETFAKAIEADPDFALAHVGRARALQLMADAPGARAALAKAQTCQRALSPREASHIAFYALVIAGQLEPAIAAARAHLAQWPRDALVLSPCTSVFGLIGFSGRRGRERETAEIMRDLAPHYGDDWWFNMQYAFALDEVGQRSAARWRIDRVMMQTPRNAYGAHIRAHCDYEDGEQAASLKQLRAWMPGYPRAGIMHCHLSWHVALCELELGNSDAAWALFDESIAPGTSQSPPINVLTDAAAFLWRAELAGAARDAARWRKVGDYLHSTFPRSGVVFVDAHAMLIDAVTGDEAACEQRLAELAERDRQGQLSSGPVVPAMARGFRAFVRRDWPAAIEAFESMVAEHERIGGSRAQRDLVEFTLLKAYLEAGRQSDVARYLDYRREGPSGIPVAGLRASA